MNDSYDEKQEDIVRYENTHNSNDCDDEIIFYEYSKEENIPSDPQIATDGFINSKKNDKEPTEVNDCAQNKMTFNNKSPYASYLSKLNENFNFNVDSDPDKSQQDLHSAEQTHMKLRNQLFSKEDLLVKDSMINKKSQLITEPIEKSSDKTTSCFKHLPCVKFNSEFNLNKYKIILPPLDGKKEEKLQLKSQTQSHIYSDSDIDIELTYESKKITDFQWPDNEQMLAKVKHKGYGVSCSNLKSEKNDMSFIKMQLHTEGPKRPGRKQSSTEMSHLRKINYEEKDENEYSHEYDICNLQKLQKENKDLKAKLSTIPSTSCEMEEIKLKLEQKTRECVEYKSKANTVSYEYELLLNQFNDMKANISKMQSELLEKENLIVALRAERKTQGETIARISDESKDIHKQNEILKSELAIQKGEVSKKSEKITECQQTIFQLEQKLIEYEIKANADTKAIRDSTQNYEVLKMTYLDLKNQYDVIYRKLQSVNAENDNMKRDYIITGRSRDLSKDKKIISGIDLSFTTLEDNEKNFVGTKPLNRIGVNNNPPQYTTTTRGHSRVNNPEGNTSIMSRTNNTSNIANENSSIDLVYVNNNKSNETLSNISTNGSLSQNGRSQGRNYRKKAGLVSSNMNIFPSQKDIVGKESKIQEIETQLYALQQEREKVRGVDYRNKLYDSYQTILQSFQNFRSRKRKY